MQGMQSVQSAPPDLGHTRVPRWILSARQRRPLLIVHVSTAAGLIGADLAVVVLGISGLSGSNPVEIYPAMALLSRWVLAPLAVTALITGVAQAVLSSYRLFRYWWVTIKLTLSVVLTVVLFLIVVPRLEVMAGATDGSVSESALDAAPRFVFIPSLAVSVLVLMVVLAFYKPRWRLDGGGGPQ